MKAIDDLELLHLFRQYTHRLDMTRKYGGQGRLMSLLREHGALTQRELVRLTGRQSATLSEQLEKMEQAGYITRERSPDDRRNIDAVLTPAGRKRAEEIAVERALLAQSLFGTLTGEEKASLARLLQKLLDAWDAGAGESAGAQGECTGQEAHR